MENKIRFVHFGRKDRLDQKLLIAIEDLEYKSKDFNRYYLAIALDYGGQDEIVRAVNEYSGMMPWQSAYSEYYFSSKNFPDFKVKDLVEALQDHSSRNRRYGK